MNNPALYSIGMLILKPAHDFESHVQERCIHEILLFILGTYKVLSSHIGIMLNENNRNKIKELIFTGVHPITFISTS